MRVLGPVVQPLVLAVLNPRQDVLLGSGVAGQLIRDHDAVRAHLLLEQFAQEPLSRRFVASALNQDVEDEPVLIDGPPEPVLHPGNFYHNLIKVPFVAGPRQPTADLIGKRLAELQRPLAHGFVADDNAACGQDLIDVPQAERKAEIEPDGVADDLGWEAVTGIVGRGRRGHRVRLRNQADLGKATSLRPQPLKLTVPFYLYLILDIYSRKIVGWEVHE